MDIQTTDNMLPAMPDPSTAEMIRAAGLRVTRPRTVVLDVLVESGGHHSAEAVHSMVGARGVTIPLTSVYNALSALTDAGLVMRADTGPGVTLFEHSHEWHHHFICRVCGEVSDTPCVVGSKPCLDTLVPGATVDEAQVIFRGICAGCQPA